MWIGLLIALGLGAVAVSLFDDDDTTEATSSDETVTDKDGTITGTSGDDTILVESEQTSEVLAGDGSDVITADAGKESAIIGADIYGEAGNDQINARAAATSDVYGGDGDDQLDLYTTPEFDAFFTPSVTPALYGDAGADTFNINLTEGALDFASFEESGDVPDSGSDLVARVQDFNAFEDTLNVDVTEFVEDTAENPTYTGFTLNEVEATDDVAAYVEVRLNFELENGSDFTSLVRLSGGPFPSAADINIIQ